MNRRDPRDRHVARRSSTARSRLTSPTDGEALALLKNRAVTDLYEPGSVMKVITAAAAIDAGVVTPDTTYYDSGVVVRRGASELAEELGRPVLRHADDDRRPAAQHQHRRGVHAASAWARSGSTQYLDAFGFGKPTGIDLQGEATRHLPPARRRGLLASGRRDAVVRPVDQRHADPDDAGRWRRRSTAAT